uniref:Helix-turn-helix domain n=1 Tax=Candidatus Kentrum eta TaxID=2126337 RepID=A0A450UG23_9GAMM|nr:MAG: Helix-turn-helix domain [Candidatus Kentron sp. H]VFJ99951.1 MAG: Helix-turn-helix domain [Candidatus Kentron sp. H]
MSKIKHPPEFMRLLKSVKAKRPRTVIEHILRHGQITTEELKDTYGYSHPPRAARDVREQGIPIITFRVAGVDGRSIAAYKFGDPSDVRSTQLSGRTAFSSDLREALIGKYGSRCNIHLEPFPERDLQIDHRVPFEIAGTNDNLSEDISDYMLLCASANRAKSWSCENCPNWQKRDIDTCKSCYWAYLESYTHIATRDIRRLDLLWSGEETAEYDLLIEEAARAQEKAPEYVKNVLRNHFKRKSSEPPA